MPAAPPLARRARPHLAALAVILLTCAGYFYPQLQGRVLSGGDASANEAITQELRDYEDATGRRSLWTDAMFGGMPAYQIYAPERGNLLRYVERAVKLGIDRPIGYFLTLALGMYVLLQVLGVSPALSVAGALTFSLGTNHLVLFDAGHMTKIRAIAFAAPTLAGLIVLFRGRTLGGLALFSLALGLQIYANHPQVTYYLAVACVCFVAFRLAVAVRRRALRPFAVAATAAFVGAALALGASWSKVATTLEYAAESTRGGAILTAAAASGGAEARGGMAWAEAMQWSNGPIDLLASLVPGAAGGSVDELPAPDGPLVRALREAGAELPPGATVPLYHGGMPMTNGPVYFGAVNVLLFTLAMCWLRWGWRLFWGGAVLLTALVSMGEHAAWLNRLLFNHLPYFDSFRAPSSATGVTFLLLTAGGVAGACYAFRLRDSAPERVPAARVYLATAIVGGGCLLVALAGPWLFDLSGGRAPQIQGMGVPLDVVVAERAELMTHSAWRSLAFVLAAGAALSAYLTRRIPALLAVALLGTLSVADVWGAGKRYLNAGDFRERAVVVAALALRPVDEEILRDPDPHYRVDDVDGNVSSARYHKLVGGYHAAKLQRYQDLIDRHLSRGSQVVLDMLNTKYIITGGQAGQPQVQPNPGALGNAWLVREVQVVPTANAEIDALNGFDPAATAVVHEGFADQLPAQRFSGSGTVALTSYAPDRLTYAFASDAAQLVVFSEIWYGPDLGWYATIDGEPAELLRADYVLRALPVPAGDHTIAMWFAPETFARGEAISYASSGIILVLGIVAAYFALAGGLPRRLGGGRAVIVEDALE